MVKIKKKRVVSLRLKYILITVVLIMVLLMTIFVSSGVLITRRSEVFFVGKLLNETKNLLQYFSSTIYDGLRFDDDMLIINTFDKVKNIESLDYAVLFDKSKKVYLHSEMYSKQNFTEMNTIINNLAKRKEISVYPSFNAKHINSAYIISKAFYDENNNFYGMLLIKYSTAQIKNEAGEIKKTIIDIITILSIMGIGIAIIIGILMATITINPIKIIIDGTEIIGGGNLDYEIPLVRNDELGKLADNFNIMTKKIRIAQVAILEDKKNQVQLKIAEEIQKATFPQEFIIEKDFQIGSFCLEAKYIGGDYHNYKKIDDKNYVFLLADVSGKGISAALVTFMINSFFNFILTEKKSLDSGEILTLTNKTLTPEFRKFERFATMLLCIYNIEKKTINFASAGHGDLVVYRKSNNNIESIENSFMPIGLEDEMEIISKTISIYEGDTIMVYSDGANEARNKEKEEYGKERLFSTLEKHNEGNVDQILKNLKEDILTFTSGADQHDDMTMVLFKQN